MTVDYSDAKRMVAGGRRAIGGGDFRRFIIIIPWVGVRHSSAGYHKPRIRAAGLFCAVVAATLMALPAGAADPPEGQEGPAAVQEGLALAQQAAAEFRAGRYERAIPLYKRSFRFHADPNTVHNLGRCYQELGTRRLGELGEGADTAPVQVDFERAITYFERYLKLEPKARNKSAVEQRIASLRSQIQLLRKPPPAPVVRIEPRSPSPWPFIGMGVGLAAVGAGVAVGAVAQAAEARANDPARSGVESLDAAEEAKTMATVANVLFAAGGVIALTSLVFGIVDWTSGDEAGNVAVVAYPGGLGMSYRF